MRIVLQNVKESHLSIANRLFCSIGPGYVLLVGFCEGDDERLAIKMAERILKMRVFQDEKGKTNLSIVDIEGSILAVPQFTLYADLSGGRRPSFTKALEPRAAKGLFDTFVKALKDSYPDVGQGVFGADMQVNLTNDGPFTLILDSRDLFPL